MDQLLTLKPLSVNVFPLAMYCPIYNFYRKRGLDFNNFQSAFQPVKKAKIISPSCTNAAEVVFEAKCDSDCAASGKSGSSICGTEGSVKSSGKQESNNTSDGRETKLLKNRESASKSRQKKKAIMQEMKEKVDRLTKEKTDASAQVILIIIILTP